MARNLRRLKIIRVKYIRKAIQYLSNIRFKKGHKCKRSERLRNKNICINQKEVLIKHVITQHTNKYHTQITCHFAKFCKVLSQVLGRNVFCASSYKRVKIIRHEHTSLFIYLFTYYVAFDRTYTRTNNHNKLTICLPTNTFAGTCACCDSLNE